MSGNKTHEQQLRIFEKREKTDNAGDDFDPTLDLKKSEAERAREQQSRSLKAGAEIQDEDRAMIRGTSQESQHHKGSGH